MQWTLRVQLTWNLGGFWSSSSWWYITRREVGDVVRPVLAQLLGHGDAVVAPDGGEVLHHLAADVVGKPPAELHQVCLREDRPD